MNYHFTTVLAHITENEGQVVELLCNDALNIQSTNPFKGNMDIQKLEECIQRCGPENIPFIRMEASTNLIGGLRFTYEPSILRLFTGTLAPISEWPSRLLAKF